MVVSGITTPSRLALGLAKARIAGVIVHCYSQCYGARAMDLSRQGCLHTLHHAVPFVFIWVGGCYTGITAT